MSAITALIDTTPAAAAIQPFAPNLQLIKSPESENESPFSAFFNAALNVMNDTNSMVATAEQMQLDFATGRMDDILAVQMAMDRAANAVNFTSQVTNRIIESYREIMRMQI
ncbi:MAG: flagellar hook-basal body complex protein FliE [Defluviitaleaceae bacterium]|nr:flagellar hook-basal body complex protein FliE [Defluviitaleaceae bacterium]